ncbi:MAG: FHA domain-containing protein [Vicinamibacteria bacterium]
MRPRRGAGKGPLPHSRPDRPTLTVEGGQVSLSVTLSPGETVLVGSDRSAGLRIVDPGVAPVHARVGWDALGVSIADAGSGRGTWLNGERVEASPLEHGDVVTFAAPRPGGVAPALRVSLPASLAEPEPLERVAPVPQAAHRAARAHSRPRRAHRRGGGRGAGRRRTAFAGRRRPSPRRSCWASGLFS